MRIFTLAAGGCFLLVTFVGSVGLAGAAEQKFLCKGQVIMGETGEPGKKPPSPIDLSLSVSLSSNGKMSIKTSDDKMVAAHVTSDNKLQLKFKANQFVGEYFRYSGDLFLIYKSGQLGRLNCSRS